MEREVYEFITAQTGEKIVERRKCSNCGQEFAITDKDLEFYSKISPVFNSIKYKIPAPTLCPDCRQQRRLARRNERKLYKRKCDLTGKTIISIYSPDSPYKVYESKEWRGDNRDSMDYSRDFDFARPFFQQFDELLKIIPRISLYGNNNENSDYSNDATNNKNCYLIFASDYNEDCMYSQVQNCKSSIDCFECDYLTESYECINCNNWMNLSYCVNCIDCRDSSCLSNCNWCQYCYHCSNLSNKKYYINNQEYDKESYFEELKNKKDSWNLNIEKNLYINKSENSIWNYIFNSKNVFYWFNVGNAEDVRYVFYGSMWVKDCMDTSMASLNASKCYNAQTCLENCYNIISCSFCNYISDAYYCESCINCKNIFGCVWLRNKQYCIFNKQYTKEEYEILVPKIIEHMKSTWERWEFFPAWISPFGYNETSASEYYPMNRESALSKWFKRMDKEYPINVPDWIELVKWQDLPDNIHDISDDILKKAVICEVSGKPFRIVKPELEFYHKHNLPLPRKHPDIRHLERLSKRASRNLYLRNCDNCGKQVISVYPADSEFKVYCENCYNKQTY